MKKILETPRLLLREFEASDAVAMFDLNEDWDVIKYTGDPPFTSELAAASFLRNYDDYNRNGFGRWAVIVKATDTFIGWCGLKRHDDGMVDIGFRFFKKDWGNGYATESAQATIRYGFDTLGLSEIVGRAASENKASIRVLEKLGMIYWKKDTCHGIEGAVYHKISRKAFTKI